MAKLLFVPDPRGTSFDLWATRCADDLCGYVWFPNPDEDNWKKWARQLYSSNSLVNESVPNPEMFKTWREWALQWMVTQN